MNNKKYIIGLTGQTGAGKSSVCNWLKEKCEIQSIDCDAVSRQVTGQSPCLEDIVNKFGKQVLNDDGTLSRKKLGEIVFSDPEKLDLLNKTVLPHIIKKIDELSKGVDSEIVVYDAPTLIESGLHEQCDLVVSVTADAELRKKRIIKRDGLSDKEAQMRIDAQQNQHFYTKYSDISILNTKNIDDLQLKAERLAYYVNHIRNNPIQTKE